VERVSRESSMLMEVARASRALSMSSFIREEESVITWVAPIRRTAAAGRGAMLMVVLAGVPGGVVKND